MRQHSFSGLGLHALKRQHILVLLLGLVCVVVMAVVVIVLGALATVASTANMLDESRSRQAIAGALETLRVQMATTVKDYSVWDEAARAAYLPGSEQWLLDNFGLNDATGAIFDVSYLLGADGKVVMGYRRGEAFEETPSHYLSPAFDAMLKKVQDAGIGPGAQASGFVKTPDGISVLAVSTIRAASPGVDFRKDGLKQIVFVRHLDAGEINGIARTYVVPGLRLVDPVFAPSHAALVKDPTGKVIGALTWTAQSPGDVSYRNVQFQVLLAVGIVGGLVAFLVMVGSAAFARLSRDEIAARGLSVTDPLSGLANRLGLFEAFTAMIGQAKSTRRDVALFYLDVDGFKEVNDLYGHQTGDELIQCVSARLLRLVAHDGVLARLGGDEFALAAPLSGGTDQVRILGEKILRIFQQPFPIGEKAIAVGISIGTTVSVEGGVGAEEALRRADIAMYRAKSEGRGRAVAYDPEMDVELAKRKDMEDALRTGLAENEFSVVYQPVVDAATGRIAGVEALLRWTSRRLGPVAPDIFIPLAETSGLIDALGLFVMKEALAAAKAWRRIGMSINVSPAQFRNPYFLTNVARLLEESTVDPACVTLEVTEGYIVHNPAHARQTIEALTRLGVKIALDDFGAGFSSIGYLRQFGFHRLKLDRSMVLALDDGAHGRKMVQATLALAAVLEIPVTAEGIETQQQAVFMQQCGCRHLQGFFFSRPVAKDALALLIEKGFPAIAGPPDENQMADQPPRCFPPRARASSI